MKQTEQAQLAIRLSAAERRAAKLAAVDLDVSVSALARRALAEYLQKLAAEYPPRRTRTGAP